MRDTTLRDIRRVVAIVEPGSETQPAIERLNYLAKSMEFDVMLIAVTTANIWLKDIIFLKLSYLRSGRSTSMNEKYYSRHWQNP